MLEALPSELRAAVKHVVHVRHLLGVPVLEALLSKLRAVAKHGGHVRHLLGVPVLEALPSELRAAVKHGVHARHALHVGCIWSTKPDELNTIAEASVACSTAPLLHVHQLRAVVLARFVFSISPEEGARRDVAQNRHVVVGWAVTARIRVLHTLF